ncbi:N-6 DNA Methylase [Oceanobacillus limi]|uniref:N-6 DNA Methylase n=1 Tax=Oceanobacillus limi TaxID=930131 RepID=A0A1I0EBC5_9BACI|nr:N-6 DNA methylase [Oceanobacillus limi]SET42219.1 N-6 DNA Methylase [Oceanobacillus limi]
MSGNITEQVNGILGINDSYEAPTKIMEILHDKERRESVFKKFLEIFDYDVSYDWFTDYFQDEHADRKKKKQDFTPRSVNTLITELTGEEYDGSHYEPCAGTGGMTIAAWQRDRIKHSPFDYKPSWYVYTCEELSDRALPFLLFNVMIRGMNAIVVHCDVLSRKSYGAFFVQNDYDDHLQFSSLNVMPYTDEVANHLAVTWEEERYEALVETPGIPHHVLYPTPRGEISDFTKVVYELVGVEVME